MRSSVNRHLEEMLRNKELLEEKPLLREIYRNFHSQIEERLNKTIQGSIVEIGSGIADIKDVIPQCITTDIFENPWIDQAENAYALSFADASVSNLILFDVFHHLIHPGTALIELARVLSPGGHLVILDPDVSLLGRIVYGLLHPEPLGLKQEIEWLAPNEFEAERCQYYAAQGNASRVQCVWQ